MNIKPFAVEEWMNEYEVGALYNIAETCVDSVSLDELFKLTGENKEDFLKDFCAQRLTYGDIWGSEALRSGISKLYHTIKADEVVLTHGAAGANHHVFCSLISAGDRVVSIMPTYQQLYSIPEAIGADVAIMHLKQENDYLPDLNELKSLVTPETKMICINNPNNPTGAVYSEQTLRALAALAVEKDFYIIADEIYEKLIFGDAKHFSIASISEEVRERCVTINGFSKAYAIPGWRLGYSAAVGEVAASIKSIQSHATSAANCIAQRAGVAALTGPQDSVEAMRREYERRRDYAFGALKAMPGVELEMPHGAFYLFPKVDSYFGTQYQNYQINSSKDLANYLLDEAEIAVVFGEAFYMNGYLRISYANSMENIQEALRRMAEALKKLGRE